MTDANSTPPAVIDADYIRTLRLSGKKAEADELLRAFYDNKKKAKLQLKEEIEKQERKKYYMMLKKSGICAQCQKADAWNGLTTCESCSWSNTKQGKRDNQ